MTWRRRRRYISWSIERFSSCTVKHILFRTLASIRNYGRGRWGRRLWGMYGVLIQMRRLVGVFARSVWVANRALEWNGLGHGTSCWAVKWLSGVLGSRICGHLLSRVGYMVDGCRIGLRLVGEGCLEMMGEVQARVESVAIL